ncbi:MAG TPA: DUF58 domain-containing protein [Methanomassiliicoccales archaeon]|jgi:uncharacterized protein (DUF58 family)
MLPRVSIEFKTFALLLVFGIFLGNVLIVLLSLLPMLFVVLSMLYQSPTEMSMSRPAPRLNAYVNENMKVISDLSIRDGLGIVTVGDSLPDHFRLAEGNNFRVFWKSGAPLQVRTEYSVECTRRGVYTIGNSKIESIDLAGLQENQIVPGLDPVELLVQQRPMDMRKMRDPRLLSRIPMPLGAASKLGSTTTDFKEIREYRNGDPFRHINWKASVRSADLEISNPLVNEYEKEGQQVVWIFLDASELMSVGSSVENAFEHGIKAANGLSQFYLARNCRVGLKVFNSGRQILPDVGRRQRAMVSKLLLGLEMTRLRGRLKEDVRSCRGHLVGSSPLFIVITMVRQENVEEMRAGIREMRMSSGPRSKVLVLHVDGNSLIPTNLEEEAAALATDLLSLASIRSLAGPGIRVVPWNPRRQSLNDLMLKGLRRK